MKLIIDSGSSKMDWVVLDQSTIVKRGEGLGINPLVDVNITLPTNLSDYEAEITNIIYYGTGTNSDEATNIIKSAMTTSFPKVESIKIYSDLLGAARAAFNDNKGIIAILGTGSNVAYYNGKTLEEDSPSLGYILGDEGSGMHIGKLILQAYFYNKMTIKDKLAFEENFETNKSELLKRIYTKEKPNKYVANYSKFLNFASSDLKKRVLDKVFEQFIETRLLPCYILHEYPVSFIGSISKVFETDLKRNLDRNNIAYSGSIKKPIDQLITYHIK